MRIHICLNGSGFGYQSYPITLESILRRWYPSLESITSGPSPNQESQSIPTDTDLIITCGSSMEMRTTIPIIALPLIPQSHEIVQTDKYQEVHVHNLHDLDLIKHKRGSIRYIPDPSCLLRLKEPSRKRNMIGIILPGSIVQFPRIVHKIKQILRSIDSPLTLISFNQSKVYPDDDQNLHTELDIKENFKGDLESTLQEISSLSLLISGDYHATIFGMVTHTPVISICFTHDMDNLIDDIGISKFSVPVERSIGGHPLDLSRKVMINLLQPEIRSRIYHLQNKYIKRSRYIIHSYQSLSTLSPDSPKKIEIKRLEFDIEPSRERYYLDPIQESIDPFLYSILSRYSRDNGVYLDLDVTQTLNRFKRPHLYPWIGFLIDTKPDSPILKSREFLASLYLCRGLYLYSGTFPLEIHLPINVPIHPLIYPATEYESRDGKPIQVNSVRDLSHALVNEIPMNIIDTTLLSLIPGYPNLPGLDNYNRQEIRNAEDYLRSVPKRRYSPPELLRSFHGFLNK